MYKTYLMMAAALVSFSATAQAQTKQVRSLAAGTEAVIDYHVTASTPQQVTMNGLVSYKNYTLSCYPSVPTFYSSDVFLTVWTGTTTLTTSFGGVYGDSITLYNLTPYKYDIGKYAIEYKLESNSAYSQTGYCKFS